MQAIVYFLLTLAIESLPQQKRSLSRVHEWWRSLGKSRHANSFGFSEPLLRPSSGDFASELDEDVDVKAERDRVLSGSTDNAVIHLRNLRKVRVFSFM